MAAVGLGGRRPLLAVDLRGRLAETARGDARRTATDEAIVLETVMVAIESGADVNLANAEGKTAWQAATRAWIRSRRRISCRTRRSANRSAHERTAIGSAPVSDHADCRVSTPLRAANEFLNASRFATGKFPGASCADAGKKRNESAPRHTYTYSAVPR